MRDDLIAYSAFHGVRDMSALHKKLAEDLFGDLFRSLRPSGEALQVVHTYVDAGGKVCVREIDPKDFYERTP